MIFINMELTWKQFQNLSSIKNLPLNEQARRYRFYLDELSNQIYSQNKGSQAPRAIPAYSGYLLQENFDYILQEDGSKIYL